MRLRRHWAIALVALLLGGVPARSIPAEEASAGTTHDGKVEPRHSLADHEAQARAFDERANELRRTLESHRVMAADYRKEGAEEAAKHCDRLIQLSEQMADEYAALAGEHREMASWQGRYQSLLEKVETARHRVERAEAEYSSNRHHRRLRGEPRRKLLDERADAESELRQAEQKLEAVQEEARRAGVPPGWLRDVAEGAGNLQE